MKDPIKLVKRSNFVTPLRKKWIKLQNIFEHFIPHLNASIFWTAGDRSFLSIFNPPLRAPTALKDNLSIEMYINITAFIRCLICEWQNQVGKGERLCVVLLSWPHFGDRLCPVAIAAFLSLSRPRCLAVQNWTTRFLYVPWHYIYVNPFRMIELKNQPNRPINNKVRFLHN